LGVPGSRSGSAAQLKELATKIVRSDATLRTPWIVRQETR